MTEAHITKKGAEVLLADMRRDIDGIEAQLEGVLSMAPAGGRESVAATEQHIRKRIASQRAIVDLLERRVARELPEEETR